MSWRLAVLVGFLTLGVKALSAQSNVTTSGSVPYGVIPMFANPTDIEQSALTQAGNYVIVNGTFRAMATAGENYFEGYNNSNLNFAVAQSGSAFFSNNVQIFGGTLGTTPASNGTPGSVLPMFTLNSSNQNNNIFSISQIRQSDGNPSDLSGWLTATTRISNTTDSTLQGYIDFNPANGPFGLAFGSGSTEWMRLINGNVGIGTTNPSAKLEVAGSETITADNSGVPQLLMRGATNNAQQLLIGYNTSSDYAYIQATKTGIANEPLALNPSNGNVGIGTTTPQATLEVNGNTQIDGNLVAGNITATSIAFPGGGTFTPALAASLTSSNGNVGIGTSNPGTALDLGGGVNFTNNNPTYQFYSPAAKIVQVANSGQSVMNLVSGIDQDGGALGALSFSRSLGQPDAHVNVAGIVGVQKGSGVLAGGQLQFWTKPAEGGATAPSAVIDQNGNVGIGTTTPNNQLQIYAPGGASPQGIMSLDVGTFGTPANATASYFFRVRDIGGNSTHFYIQGDGNVGIGTTSPGAALEVNGNVRLTSGSGASITFADGTTQSTAYSGTCVATGGDYAESVDVTGAKGAYEPGDVMVIDKSSPSDFRKSSAPYSKRVAGIYSTKPGYIGRRQRSAPSQTKEEVPMAMIGIVPAKVSTENGAIEPGDLLVSSTKEGYAMKGTDPSRMMGSVIGKAMGSLESGNGVIEVLVTLQ